jgi:hypothetical protein
MFAYISNETAKMDDDCYMFAYISNETAKMDGGRRIFTGSYADSA